MNVTIMNPNDPTQATIRMTQHCGQLNRNTYQQVTTQQ
jgi:hypothetical protein